MYLINILLMSTIRMNDGSTKASVATTLPSTARGVPIPAFCTAT